VTFDGDDIGRWLQRQTQPTAWAQLSSELQERLSKLGLKPVEAPSPAPTAKRSAKGPSKAQQAFQRGLTALAQWVEREGERSVPCGHSEQIAVDGETEPVIVKLSVWVSNTKSRRDKLTQDQLTRYGSSAWSGRNAARPSSRLVPAADENGVRAQLLPGPSLVAGAGFEPRDLWVMSPASYRAAPPRVGDTTVRHTRDTCRDLPGHSHARRSRPDWVSPASAGEDVRTATARGLGLPA
jgi:hypothetical protein